MKEHGMIRKGILLFLAAVLMVAAVLGTAAPVMAAEGDGVYTVNVNRYFLDPQTGLSGELVVLEGEGRARRGMRYPVIREGTLGSARSADVRVRHPSVRPRHARFELTEEGLSLTAVSGAKLLDGDGERVRKLLLRDGDCFTAGSVLLTLVLIDATGRAGDYEGQEDELFDAPVSRPPRGGEPREAGEDAPYPDEKRPRSRAPRPVARRPENARPARREGAENLFLDDDLDEDNF